MTVTARCLLLSLGLLACTPKIQEEYDVEIVSDLKENAFAGATRAVLEVNDKEVASATVVPRTAFILRGSGINVRTNPSAIFKVKAFDQSGTIVAQGQSPEIELELASPPVIRIFVQRPGSFGRTFDLDIPRRHMIALPVVGVPADIRAKPVTVALFGLGNVTVPGDMNTTVERPSEVLNLFNPVTQIIEPAGVGGAPSGSPRPRALAGATTNPVDNRAIIFGGAVSVDMKPVVPSGQVDALRVQRSRFDVFERGLIFRETNLEGVARVAPVLVHTDATYAVGGRSDKAVLDTIVTINPDVESNLAYTVLPQRLAGPRDGHTGTVVATARGPEALIFGGASPGVSVAEVMVAPGPMLVTPTGNAGPPRRDHAAVVLPPGDRVLIIGGRSDSGVLGDTILYQGAGRTLAPATLTLKRPRTDFAAFVVGDDLVVAGGLDSTGALIETAEIYSATDLQPKALDVPCHGRFGAAVVVLPHRFVLLIGGTEADPTKVGFRRASRAVETYQPMIPTAR